MDRQERIPLTLENLTKLKGGMYLYGDGTFSSEWSFECPDVVLDVDEAQGLVFCCDCAEEAAYAPEVKDCLLLDQMMAEKFERKRKIPFKCSYMVLNNEQWSRVYANRQQVEAALSEAAKVDEGEFEITLSGDNWSATEASSVGEGYVFHFDTAFSREKAGVRLVKTDQARARVLIVKCYQVV